jgi:gamma-glutamylcyclotransferase (GGCT)/AIG2-like uncharacterized protein YtfP
MTPSTDVLFVYGTLMPGASHPMAARLAGESRLIGPASVCGRLYDLGRYPGAVASGAAAERVHGQILRLSDPERSLTWLDAYEGTMPDGEAEPDGFARVIVPARLASGRQIHAWMYLYRGGLVRARYLRSGRYAARKSLARLRS